MIRAIIIDDEADGRQAVRTAVETYCREIKIVAVCESPEQGLEAIDNLKPELVFLDVQMPGMSGFDLLEKLSPVSFEVIFITAYDQYAIKAIRFSALDYLLKPIDINDLLRAAEKVKERVSRMGDHHRLMSVLNNIHYRNGALERIAVPTLEGIDFFNTNDIIYCKSEGSYTVLHLINGKTGLVSRNLKDFEDLLNTSDFCRVHHSYLINMHHVQKYVKGEGGYVILSEGHHASISRRKKEEFLGLLHKV